MGRLLVFADYTCPFCYLAETELARLRQDGVDVEGAAFELRPAGTPLPTLRERYMHDGWRYVIEPLREELQVSMRFPTVATRTRKAHEAAAWARERGGYERMHLAIYRAYWEHGADIGRIDVLMDIGGGEGFDRAELRVALDIDSCTERVEQDVARATRLRLTGVPAYIRVTQTGTGGSAADDAGTADGGDVRTGLLRYDELKSWMVHE